MTNEERVRRLVDGELDASESDALLADAARDPALAALIESTTTVLSALAALERTESTTAPDDLVERTVRHAIAARDRAERERSLASGWLRAVTRPRTVRVRPVTLLLAAGALAAAAALALAGRPHVAAPALASGQRATPLAARTSNAPPVAETRVPVRFVLPANGARSVTVAGDFNGWKTDVSELTDEDGDGGFVGSVDLAPGSYTYMFVVDGRDWVADPYAASYQDDGFGNRNAVLRL